MFQLHQESLDEAFELSVTHRHDEQKERRQQRAFISLSGCNGKTSLLKLLARTHQTALLGTSTKMKVWDTSDQLDHYPHFASCTTLAEFTQLMNKSRPSHLLIHGIADRAKYSCPSPVLLERAFADPHFLLAVFEADGSRGLALKAWGDLEPVILPQTTHTIGVLPQEAFSLHVDQHTVCRFELFCKRYLKDMSSSYSNPALIAKLVSDPRGLFKNARGKRFLFINKCDDLALYLHQKAAPRTEATLKSLSSMLEELSEIQKKTSENIQPDKIIIGSVHNAIFASLRIPDIER